MESILATGSDGQQLIPQLKPQALTNQASYIIARTQTTTTSPIPVASPTGVRTIKWNIVDSNFLDLSSLHFSFTVNVGSTAAANNLVPLSAIPHCWFRRLVIKINGSTVEDLTELSRMESQLSMFLSTQKKKNLGDAGTGWAEGIDEGIDFAARPIAVNTSRRCTWRPLSSGFLDNGKFLPITEMTS